jgi:hypothetical protein
MGDIAILGEIDMGTVDAAQAWGVQPALGLATLDLLDERECTELTSRVMQLSAHWRRRNPHTPFFTLGLASYIDGVEGDRPYRDEALRKENNALIGENFAPLLATVAEALGTYFGMPVELARHAAWPGFHVFLPHPVFSLPVASVHRDLQYLQAFPDRDPGQGDVFSFTLPVSTPSGSGLNLWPGCQSASGTPEFVPYSNGQLLVHDGLSVHQAVLQSSGEVPRITLQGHGIKTNNEFIELYW